MRGKEIKRETSEEEDRMAESKRERRRKRKRKIMSGKSGGDEG